MAQRYLYWRWSEETTANDPLTFDGAQWIQPQIGAHGIGCKLDGYEVGLYYDQEKQAYDGPQPGVKCSPMDPSLTPQQFLESQYGPIVPPPTATARLHSQAAASKVTISDYPIIEFVLMGKLHRYYAVDGLYEQLAPIYRKHLVLEGRALDREMSSKMDTYNAFLADEGFVGYLVHGTQTIRGLFGKSLPELKPTGFYLPLIARCRDALGRVTGSATTTYADLHDAGLDFMRIRRRLEQVNDRCNEALKCLTESAEVGKQTAEYTEEYAFKVLDLYGQVRYFGNDTGLAIYKVLIHGLRAVARGGSAYFLSDDRTGAVRAAILSEVVPALKKDMPGTLKGLIVGKLKGRMVSMPFAAQTRKDVAVEKTCELLIDVIFDALIFAAFEQEKPWDDFWDDEESKVPTKIVSMAFAVIKGPESEGGGEDGEEEGKKLEWFCDLMLALTEAVADDIDKLKDRAKEENTKPLEIFFKEIPQQLIRTAIVFAALLALDKGAKPWMQKRDVSEMSAKRRNSALARQVALLLSGKPFGKGGASGGSASAAVVSQQHKAVAPSAAAPDSNVPRSRDYFNEAPPAFPPQQKYDRFSPRQAAPFTKSDAAKPLIAVDSE